MKKLEFPIYILICSLLLTFVLDFTAWQGLAMTVLSGAAFWTGRRVRA